MAFHFENIINSIIRQKGLIQPGNSVLIAVSGGADSMCLAFLLHKLQFQVAVAHVNFRLRGPESDLDEALVKEWCLNTGVPFHVASFDTQAEAQKLKKGIQETARILRYDWFEQLSIEFKYNKIAVAHHLDDQAETVLFNLIRGSGLNGAKGISIQLGKIIRPLITVPKIKILNYVTEHKIPYRQDQSNLKSDYSRNKIRHEVLPLLNTINPKAAANVAQFGLRLQSVLPAYLAWKKTQTEKYLTRNHDGYIIRFPEVIEAGIWYVILEEFGFNEDQVSHLHQSIQSKAVGKLFISGAYQLFYTGNFVEIRPTTTVNLPIHIRIEQLPFRAKLIEKEFTFKWSTDEQSGPTTWQLDLRQYSLPLTLRTWLPGDRFTPVGMQGSSKKIQDYLTDSKVSGFQKKQALVLVSKEEIIWVWPHGRISETVKPGIDKSTLMSISVLETKTGHPTLSVEN
ncbi:MAG: tRNA lysidine(34) synthetase TilS [Saprospiraceae bacterium]|nr:tRNA lysidine(34) synthetase TilS [Saprospiraceae bacterium]